MEKGKTDLSGVAKEHANGVRESVRGREWFVRMPGAAKAPMTVIGAAVGIVGLVLFFLGLTGGFASIGAGLVIAAVVHDRLRPADDRPDRCWAARSSPRPTPSSATCRRLTWTRSGQRSGSPSSTAICPTPWCSG